MMIAKIEAIRVDSNAIFSQRNGCVYFMVGISLQQIEIYATYGYHQYADSTIVTVENWICQESLFPH